MNEIKTDYDEEADVLYVSFGRNEHVTGIELADNILLRLDTGKMTGTPPRAVGLTFTSFARMMADDGALSQCAAQCTFGKPAESAGRSMASRLGSADHPARK